MHKRKPKRKPNTKVLSIAGVLGVISLNIIIGFSILLTIIYAVQAMGNANLHYDTSIKQNTFNYEDAQQIVAMSKEQLHIDYQELYQYSEKAITYDSSKEIYIFGFFILDSLVGFCYAWVFLFLPGMYISRRIATNLPEYERAHTLWLVNNCLTVCMAVLIFMAALEGPKLIKAYNTIGTSSNLKKSFFQDWYGAIEDKEAFESGVLKQSLATSIIDHNTKQETEGIRVKVSSIIEQLESGQSLYDTIWIGDTAYTYETENSSYAYYKEK